VRTHASSLGVDRRVTFDRAVWTKPLAFAADAVLPLCALNREDHRRACVPDRHGIARGAWQTATDARDGLAGGLRGEGAEIPPAFARASASCGGWGAGDGAYELS
jgi:hypothetical protein